MTTALTRKAAHAYSAAYRQAAQGEALMTAQAITEHAMQAALEVVADELFPANQAGFISGPACPRAARGLLTGRQ